MNTVNLVHEIQDVFCKKGLVPPDLINVPLSTWKEIQNDPQLKLVMANLICAQSDLGRSPRIEIMGMTIKCERA